MKGKIGMILQIMNCYDEKINVNVGELADILMISVKVLSGDEILQIVKKNGKILEIDSDRHGRLIDFYDGEYTIYNPSIGLNKISAWRKRKDSNDWIMLPKGTNDALTKRQIKKEEQNMELKDTVELMLSEDWKDRFVAEYLQTKIRYEKLHRMIIKREAGRQEFNTPIPLESWKTQANLMGRYLYELEKQAAIHGIELPITILAVK